MWVELGARNEMLALLYNGDVLMMNAESWKDIIGEPARGFHQCMQAISKCRQG
jgi:hypothetical protein